MTDLIIYVGINICFIIIQIVRRAKIAKNCAASMYKTPVWAYRWHILGMLIIFAMLAGIIWFNTKRQIETYMPNVLFVSMTGLLSGLCSLCIVMYAFSRVGIFENGICTHFMFVPFEKIESYMIIDSNMLHIGKDTRTVSFKIKNNSSNHPSFEYPVKQEALLKLVLKECDVREMFDAECDFDKEASEVSEDIDE